MDYNGRASQQFRSQGTGNGGRGRQQQQQHDSDAFMRLPDREIAGCISDIGVPFSPEDLLKPNPQQVQRVFEWFAELLMNTTRETVEPAMRAAAEDVCRDYSEIVSADTRNLMGFYVSLRKLLVECGINDFSFSDLLKPTHDRLVKIFSYIINFVRFRESQTSTIDEHFNKSETTKARIETLYLENQDMTSRLDDMRLARKEMDVQLREKKRRNDELKSRLLEMRKDQERISRRHDEIKSQKSQMAKSLEQKTERSLAIRQESEKLRPYVSQSPQALQSQLSDLSENLARDRAQIDNLEKRTRALQTSHDSFSVLTSDINSCTKILQEIHLELQKEEEEAVKAAKRRDALSDRSNSVREVERKEKTLQRQLERWQEKTEQLEKNSKERQGKAETRMEGLKGELVDLKRERAEKEREMSRRKVRIEQAEKKMADLKETIESEVQAAQTEYQKMDSHIRLYVTEMEQATGMVVH